jgi:diaminohydroxyphosphoribosylaminopyrimidine deaminase/5-amino-6-(5-phosphoribosylamino)uracil reductase
LREHGAEVARAAANADGLDLGAVLKLLAGRGITRLMVEGGPMLAAALIVADLVDEAILFHSAKVLGSDAVDALDGAARAMLAARLRGTTIEPVGPDREEFYERR